MGKHYVWTCDVCGKQVKDNSENNFQVMLTATGALPVGNQMFDGIICDNCTDKKSTQEILFAVAEEGKKATSLIKVASVTFKAIKVDNTIEGVPVKALTADSITESIEEIKP